jgi:hypothetical protein
LLPGDDGDFAEEGVVAGPLGLDNALADISKFLLS